VTSEPEWPWAHVKPWAIKYRAWDGVTTRHAVVVLPSSWSSRHHPGSLPLVISPHGRNSFAWANALRYWQNLPAQGPFALVCPDGLARARSAASDPLDRPANPSLFTYGNRGHIDDLARMPRIVQERLPWLRLQTDRVYILGSSMGGQETLLLSARYPNRLAGGQGRLAGAAAFDAPCDLARQCAYLTHRQPNIASRMIEEVGRRPASLRGWNRQAVYFNKKRRRHSTIGELLSDLPKGQEAWDDRSALHYLHNLAALPFPLRIYWSTKDVVVGHQERDQSGKLYRRIKQLAPHANVEAVRGTWAHSREFVPNRQLGQALRDLGLIDQV
jgi:pimeloyl-ACP methyl ester carboxylesterase